MTDYGERPLRFASYTLGCKVNQYETEALEEALMAEGFSPWTEGEDSADLILINTCTVTNMSDRKSRQVIRRMKKEHPRAKVCVAGCYVQTHPEELEAMEEVDLLVGTKDRGAFVPAVQGLIRGEEQEHAIEAHRQGELFESMSVTNTQERTRAYLKVQDGCNQYCSYCIIPYARGFIRSRDLEEAVAEAKKLMEGGFREIVVTGIHVGSYGKEAGEGPQLIDLLEALGETGVERIRLSSVEPMTMTEEFMERLSKIPAFMPHFHLSLQSGSEKVLREMNRKYTKEEYRETVARIRRHYAHPGITTDIIVGFPGETEEEFEETEEFVRSIGFHRIHIFPYSPREGTPAAQRKDQIPGDVKKDRVHQLEKVARAMAREAGRELLGLEVPVLVEEWDGSYGYGYTPNYLRVRIPLEEDRHNEILCVTIEKQVAASSEELLEGLLATEFSGR
ncbi:MAG: tRNA (N(6)-L-threonylcarbamoyladenosine(37)-C(2))-methylthiotransferase MtaB [Tissierellia bacterium]|nr:tRNA (N(6)-L-threonylcarbamoyladenosine(37)-C(2))-methylthiotransferase MtaB [Tissierellia bacterium]